MKKIYYLKFEIDNQSKCTIINCGKGRHGEAMGSKNQMKVGSIEECGSEHAWRGHCDASSKFLFTP